MLRGFSFEAATMLTAIKAAHTLVWALLASCVVAIPVVSLGGHHLLAIGFAAVVSLEGAVLAFNRGRCPLTVLAARYTADRTDNFDIYLPLWLARHNKRIFGSIFGFGTALAVVQWSLASR
jgi:hypothetical protein